MKIYLDNAATTQIDPEVIRVMHEELSSPPANPSSIHSFGQEAKKRLTLARKTIGDLLKVRESEIIFSSGATESLNALLRGFFAQDSTGHLITSDIEHASVYQTVKFLEQKGVSVTYLPAGTKGFVSADQVQLSITDQTRLVVLSGANSETGIKIPLTEIATLLHRRGIPFLVDGVALLGKDAFSIPLGVSAMVFSAHKFHGPKGVGFAYVQTGFKWETQLTGGPQEGRKRAGTENLPGILGLAKALQLVFQEKDAPSKMQALCRKLEQGLKAHFENLIIHGEHSSRVSNISNIAFPGLDGEDLLIQLDRMGIAASHGSACASGAFEPSRVLLNMGLSKEVVRASVRFSLSRFTTEEEIDQTLNALNTLCAQRSF